MLSNMCMGLSNTTVPRMSMASPEDVEYAQCQEQLNQDLLKEHLLVERVIGQCSLGVGPREDTPLFRGWALGQPRPPPWSGCLHVLMLLCVQLPVM